MANGVTNSRRPDGLTIPQGGRLPLRSGDFEQRGGKGAEK